MTGSIFEVLKLPESQEVFQHILRASASEVLHTNTLRHPTVVTQLYDCALKDSQGCSILITRNAITREITSSAVLYSSRSELAEYFPIGEVETGGITGIMVGPGEQWDTLVQGLLAMAVAQFKARGFVSVRLHQVRLALYDCSSPLSPS